MSCSVFVILSFFHCVILSETKDLSAYTWMHTLALFRFFGQALNNSSSLRFAPLRMTISVVDVYHTHQAPLKRGSADVQC